MLPLPMNEKGVDRSEAVTAGLRAARLHESDRSTVEYFLDRTDDAWRECCGSDCVPCVSQVAQAVDVARGLMKRGGSR